MFEITKKIKKPKILKTRPIVIEDYGSGCRTDLELPLYMDALSRPVKAPFIVVRGQHPGPTVGITAAVHGNELNGIKIIHHVLSRINPEELRGTLLCCPVVNVLAFQANQRRFPEDERDLNHQFPGKIDGTQSQQYARAFVNTFIEPCDYLIDIHTASQGRINSFYIRADLTNPEIRKLALLMDPQIVLHNKGSDKTLRYTAQHRGIPAITVEAGNPMVFQGKMALEGEQGIINILSHLKMIKDKQVFSEGNNPIICKSSRWLRIRSGGLLETKFSLCETIEKKQVLAEISDPFGRVIDTYQAPRGGAVIGMVRSPVAVPGTRFCHLGSIGEPDGK